MVGDILGLMDSILWGGRIQYLQHPYFGSILPRLDLRDGGCSFGCSILDHETSLHVPSLRTYIRLIVRFGSFCNDVRFSHLVSRSGEGRYAQKAMLYMYLVHVVAAVFAASVNHEPNDFGQVMGGVLIVLGITYVKGGYDTIKRGIRHRRCSSGFEQGPRQQDLSCGANRVAGICLGQRPALLTVPTL